MRALRPGDWHLRTRDDLPVPIDALEHVEAPVRFLDLLPTFGGRRYPPVCHDDDIGSEHFKLVLVSPPSKAVGSTAGSRLWAQSFRQGCESSR